MRKKHLIGAALFVTAVLAWALLYHPDTHPNDQELIEYFNSHRTDFDRLVNMAFEDRNLTAIYPRSVLLDHYGVWPTTTTEGFSYQRWDQYKSVFGRLNEYGINGLRKESDLIHIPASTRVSRLDDFESIVIVKGYAFSTREPSRIVNSLDKMNFESKGTHYRRIDEHWYLYHEWGISKPE